MLSGIPAVRNKRGSLICFLDPPENIEISQDVVTVEAGISPEKILCTAEAYPQANYFWKFGDDTVATDNLLFFDKGISRHQSGEYTCIAQNRHGSSEIKTKFDVLCKCSVYFPGFHYPKCRCHIEPKTVKSQIL